jgi:hypothetical protein
VVKKTITYTNPFTEQEVTEDHYFHISKADLVEMEVEAHKETYLDKDGNELTGMQAHLQRMVDAEDARAVLKEFKAIIARAYGKKEGDRFIKNPQVLAEFEGSEAYSELLFQLLTDADEMSKFVNSIVPGNLEQIAAEVAARADVAEARQNGSTPTDRQAEIAAATSENPVTLTRAELVAMDDATYRAGLADGRFKLA